MANNRNILDIPISYSIKRHNQPQMSKVLFFGGGNGTGIDDVNSGINGNPVRMGTYQSVDLHDLG